MFLCVKALVEGMAAASHGCLIWNFLYESRRLFLSAPAEFVCLKKLLQFGAQMFFVAGPLRDRMQNRAKPNCS